MWLWNHLSFELRRALPRFRRGPFQECFKGADDQLESLSKDASIPLTIARALSERSLRLTASYFWRLRHLPKLPFSLDCVLDLGSKDFGYAVALSQWVLEHEKDRLQEGQKKTIEALEVDPYVLYWDLWRRGDVAQARSTLASSLLPGTLEVSYRASNWLKEEIVPPSVDLICCFYPFLFEELHKNFRLKKDSFNPCAFYAKAIQTTQGGLLFFHQGEEEADVSREILSGHKEEGSIVFEKTFTTDPYLPNKFSTTMLLWLTKRFNEADHRFL